MLGDAGSAARSRREPAHGAAAGKTAWGGAGSEDGPCSRRRGARHVASRPMAQTIAVLSQKGGTGKTTAVRTLADVLRRSGVRTLAVDLDPQGSLSDYFAVPGDGAATIADVLSGRSPVAAAIHRDLIPADLSLAETELALAGRIGREVTLRRALAEAPEDYEVILIDCPPSLGLLTVNALVAADRALITSEAQYFARRGVERAMEVVELARDSLNPELSLLGVLLNLADMRTVHSREAHASLRERFEGLLFGTVVRASIAYAESAELARSILDHRPDLGADYLALADEVLARLPGLGDARRRLAAVGESGGSSGRRRTRTPDLRERGEAASPM
jgi:chromosome partitioning protein